MVKYKVTVQHFENGSGQLQLEGAGPIDELWYNTAPEEVTALNGIEIEVGENDVVCEGVIFAHRAGRRMFFHENFVAAMNHQREVARNAAST